VSFKALAAMLNSIPPENHHFAHGGYARSIYLPVYRTERAERDGRNLERLEHVQSVLADPRQP
jgi:hypothetical protein